MLEGTEKSGRPYTLAVIGDGADNGNGTGDNQNTSSYGPRQGNEADSLP